MKRDDTVNIPGFLGFETVRSLTLAGLTVKKNSQLVRVALAREAQGARRRCEDSLVDAGTHPHSLE
ncbi:hypothetical protein DFH07DRAFT_974999 [Mycena maculata]|uniref:Uncharacterized protein n=1 Tax=Mycena maculata TaxID=230809 RepID=A0AAD7MDK1_9AGAR|nr:hypothetical protein DFH07DRAFT_974999 [Mycena maculata]